MDDSTKVDYLFECFRTAREELLLRVKHRDNWLKIQLLAQASLLALAQGVELSGVKAAYPKPDVLAISVAISFVLASLYYIGDDLVGYLSDYVGAVSGAEAKLRLRRYQITNWDISEQLRLYAHQTLPIRFLAQLIIFVFIPLGLGSLRISNFTTWGVLEWVEAAFNSILLIMILRISVRAFLLRRETGKVPTAPVLSSYESVSSNKK